MATPFNLTARINFQAVNLKPTIDNIRSQFKGLKANISISMDKNLNTQLKNLNKTLVETEARLKSIQTSSAAASKSLKSLSTSMNKGAVTAQRNAKSGAKVNTMLAKTARGAAEAASEVEEFGRVSGLAIRRFAGFTIATGVIFGFINAVKQGVSEAIKFEREVIRLAQITKTSVQGISIINSEVTKLAKTWGVASGELILAARTLKQAGFTANETRVALEALAKSDLAPTFSNITQTTEGSIAALRQFKLEARDLDSVLGSINAVAGRFAVESEDLIGAIRRAGGVFSAASAGAKDYRGELITGQDKLRQFISLFTSVRATTRESAESIATGLRTIFTRVTRRSTRDALRELGVELETVEGKFVGGFEAIKRLNKELSKMDPSDLRFFQISEQIAGFRQIGKVIPLILRFSDAQRALQVAQEGTGSLTEDAITAQQSLAIQINKTKENFLALVRDITKTDTFRVLAKTTLLFADSLVSLADSLKSVLPALAIFAGIKSVGIFGNFLRGFRRGVTSVGGVGGVGERLATGGGAKDTNVQAQNTVATQKNTQSLDQATKGEKSATKSLQTALVANTKELVELQAVLKSLIRRIGAGRARLGMGGMARRRRFKTGGLIPGFGDGDRVPFMGEGGEFVVNRRGVQRAGLGALIGLNGGGELKSVTATDVTRYLGIPSAEARKLIRKGNPQKASIEARVRKVRGDAGNIIPSIGTMASPLVAGLFGILGTQRTSKAGEPVKYGPNTIDQRLLTSQAMITDLVNAKILPKGFSGNFQIPIFSAFPDKKRVKGFLKAISQGFDRTVANTSTAMSGNTPSKARIRKTLSGSGIDIRQAAGDMFEASLLAAYDLDRIGGRGAPLDFATREQISELQGLYGPIPSLAGDAKLTASKDAFKSIRKGFTSGLMTNAPLLKAAKKFAIKGKARGGGVGANVALMPGEDVFYPEQVAKIGIGNLRKANATGDRTGLMGHIPAFTVPGKGSTDSYYTSLPEGSFVIRKKFSEGFATGGRVGMANGGEARSFDFDFQAIRLNKAFDKLMSRLMGAVDRASQTTSGFTQELKLLSDELGISTTNAKKFAQQQRKGEEGKPSVRRSIQRRAGQIVQEQEGDLIGGGVGGGRIDVATPVQEARREAEIKRKRRRSRRFTARAEAREGIFTPSDGSGRALSRRRQRLERIAEARAKRFSSRLQSRDESARMLRRRADIDPAAPTEVGGIYYLGEQKETLREKRGRRRDRRRQRVKNIALARERPGSRYAYGTFDRDVELKKQADLLEREKREAGYSPEIRKKLAASRTQEEEKAKRKADRKSLGRAGGRVGERARKAYDVALRKGATSAEAMAKAQDAAKAVVKQQETAQKKLAVAQRDAAMAVRDYGKRSREAKIAQKELADAQRREAKSLGRSVRRGRGLRGLGGRLGAGGRLLNKGGDFLTNKLQSPAAIGLLFAAPMLTEAIEDRGVSGGITGALGGAFAGAQFGPAGMILGGIGGGVTAAITGAQEQRLEKAQKAITDSASEVDKAFEHLSKNLNDTTAIENFNAALNQSVTAALGLQNVFSKEEEFGGSLGATFASIYGGDKRAAAETGVLATASREFRKTFGGITDDLGGVITYGVAPLLGVADLIAGGAEGRREAFAEEEAAIQARNKRRNQEIFQALQPGARSSQQFLQRSLEQSFKDQGQAFASFDKQGKDLDRFVNEQVKKFTANSKQAVQSLAALDPKKFAKLEPQLNEVANRLDEIGKKHGTDSIEYKKAQEESAKRRAAILEKAGREYIEAETRKQSEIAVTQAKIEAQIQALGAAAEELARIGTAAEKVAQEFSIAFEDIGTISTVGSGGRVGLGGIRNPFEDIANSTREELEFGRQALLGVAGGRFGKITTQAAEGIGQSKIIKDNFLNIVRDALQSPDVNIKGEERAIKDRLRYERTQRLRGVSDETFGDLMGQITGLFSNRQGKGFVSGTDLFKHIEDATNAYTKNLDVGSESFAKAFNTLVQSSSKVVKGFNEASKLTAQANQKFDAAFKLGGQRAQEIQGFRGKKITVAQAGKQTDDFVKRLTARAGVGGPGGTTDIGVIEGAIKGLRIQIVRDQKLRKEVIGKEGSLFNSLTQRIEANTTKLSDAKQALDTLASATQKLTAIQNKLAELQQRREAGRNFLEKLSRAQFDPQARIEVNRSLLDAQKFLSGRGSGQEAGGLNAIRELAGLMSPEDQAMINRNIARQQFHMLEGAGPIPPAFRRLLLGSGALTGQGESTEEQRLIKQYEDASKQQIEAIKAQGRDAVRQRKEMILHLRHISAQMGGGFGRVLRQASGGWVTGPYKGNRDTEVRKLVPGEFVVRRSVAQRFGPQLEAVNAGVPVEAAFAGGGSVLTEAARRKNVSIRAARKGIARRLRLGKGFGGALGQQMLGIAMGRFISPSTRLSKQKLSLALSRGDYRGAFRESIALGGSEDARTLRSYLRARSVRPYNMRMSRLKGRAFDAAVRLGVHIPRGSRFSSGGMVAGVVPGEFVVNRNVVSGNIGFLNSLNKTGSVPGFQGGGAVASGGGGFNFAQLTSAMGQFAVGVNNLVPALSGFAQFATQLVKASSDLQKVNIPSTIQLEVAPMQVNVVINGAEALAQMQEPLSQMVQSKINEALATQVKINPITGETDASFVQV